MYRPLQRIVAVNGSVFHPLLRVLAKDELKLHLPERVVAEDGLAICTLENGYTGVWIAKSSSTTIDTRGRSDNLSTTKGNSGE